ncbi:MAG: hypothetical protein J5I28_09820 [Acidimicrobiales bacterium]|nr:hypothetical protein [Acidimicrobiales bacterium]HLV91045.1 hypothetical protein [Acidimicrobiia bacterium]
MTFEIPSRPRRRLVGRLILPLLVAGLVVLGIVITAAGAETRAQIDYLDRLSERASLLADGPVALTGVISRLATISRVEFTTAMDGLIEDLDAAAEVLAEEPPNRAVLPVRALYRQAVNAWREGVSGMSVALLQAADNPNDPAPVDQLVVALSMLQVGDEVWAELLLDVETDDVPDPLRPFPEIAMTPTGGAALDVALGYIGAARAETNTLGLRPGIKVSSLLSDPEWHVDAQDQVVVPVTDQVVFSVVVTNVGNITTEAETLILTVGGGPEPVQLQLPVEPLAPERQVTLTFDPVTVEPGGVYEVVAEITVDTPDLDLTDNRIAVQFHVGAE